MPVNLKQAAIAWANEGYFVFPCVANGKTPAVAAWQKVATNDPARVAALWDENPNSNIGVVPALSGMWVLDVDKPPLGTASLARLEVTNGALPPTLTIRTPSGGTHLWFEGQIPTSASKLGEHIDTRGGVDGSGLGYVLVPPSIVKGNPYVVERDAVISEAPSWVAMALQTSSVAVAAPDVELDLPGNITRAKTLLASYVDRNYIAIEGAGGDNRTYQVACEVLNLGLSPARALDLIDEIWNPHCSPPWDRADLEAKIANASAYAQNSAGAWAVEPVEQVFADVAKTLAHNTPSASPSRFYPLSESEQDALPDPAWLLPNLIPDEAIVLMYGPSGEYKSFLALDMALHVASGIEGYGRDANEGSPVVYIAAEGARAIVRKRRPAWRIAKQVEHAVPFYAVDTMPLTARPDEIIELIEAIKARNLRPALVVLDTVARAMAGQNENDAKDAGVLVEAVECIKRAFGCAVLALHHTGKEEARGARGSSALFAGFDTVLSVSAHKISKCVEVRVRKQKDADEAEDPLLFQGQVVGPSLVFHQINSKEYRQLTAEEDQFTRAKIGSLLRNLGAVGIERAVTSRILAAEFIEGHASAQQIEAIEKRLRRLGKGQLEAYHEAGAWFLPAEEKQDNDCE